MDKVTAQNLQTYYNFSGRKSMPMIYELILSEDIKEDALRRALKRTLKRYPLYRHTIEENENKGIHYVPIPEDNPYPIFTGEKKNRRFGSDETGGYLFTIWYLNKHFIMEIFHGLSDGTGANAFIQTLLYCYATECGVEVKDTKNIRLDSESPRESETEDVYAKYSNTEVEEFYKPKEVEPFGLPEEFFGEEVNSYKLFELELEFEQLLKLSKSAESSPAPMLSVVIAQAIYETYNVGDKIITGCIPVNLRGIFNTDSIENCVMTVPVIYHPRLRGMELSKQATCVRANLDLLVQKENAIVYATKSVSKMHHFCDGVHTPGEIADIFINTLRPIGYNMYSYMLSYVGNVVLPQELENMVEKIIAHTPPFSTPFGITAFVYKGKMRMLIAQNFESEALVHNISKKLTEIGIENELYFKGYNVADYLLL